MAQLSPRRANLLARGTLLGSIIGIGLLASLYWVYLRSPMFTGEGVPRPQPVPYSHQLHVGELGLDCRYCHASLELSPVANVPPTRTCINFHPLVNKDIAKLKLFRESSHTVCSLRWVTLHQLPAHVSFRHR